MHLHLQLIAQTENSSLSIFSKEGKFVCFVLEDGYREAKVKHETRIPPGTYTIIARRYGKFFQRYRGGFVPEITGVPGFSDILIHPGNTVADTSGCLLTGAAVGIDAISGNFYISEKKSSPAYFDVCDLIAAAFEAGEAVTLTISRELVMTA